MKKNIFFLVSLLLLLHLGCKKESPTQPVEENALPNLVIQSYTANQMVGDTCIFSAEQSFDKDKDSLRFQWVLVVSPNGSTSTIQNPEFPICYIVPDRVGIYALMLSLSDGKDTVKSDTLKLVIATFFAASYNFDEPSGTTINDASGNGLDGTAIWTQRVDGKVGKAMQLQNIDARCEIPAQGDFNNKISIDIWLKPYSTSSLSHIIGDGYYGLASYRLELNQGAIYFLAEDNGWITLISSKDTVRVNTWTHVCVTFDGETAKLYLNGILDNQKNVGLFDLPISYNRLFVGLRDSYSFEFVNHYIGLMDELRVWKKVLTADEINQYYNQTK